MNYPITFIAVICGILIPGQLKIDSQLSTISIKGTSSLHDWEMSIEEFDASGSISEGKVENLKLSLTAKSMKSGKSVMDGKAHNAVKADQYPEIYFAAKELIIKDETLSGKGRLELAGQSKELTLAADIVSNTTSEMRLKGNIPLKMTDFAITPPTAMFGTLKTGDEVTVVFDVLINK